eukprot:scaffold1326_cov51-Cyclotella_meneghiniana.AAC.7
MATLYSVHKSSSFHIQLPNWTLDTPTGMGMGMGSGKQRRREMKEMGEAEEAAEEEEEEEEEEEQREPMNIILFYADDWRHDVSFV